MYATKWSDDTSCCVKEWCGYNPTTNGGKWNAWKKKETQISPKSIPHIGLTAPTYGSQYPRTRKLVVKAFKMTCGHLEMHL